MDTVCPQRGMKKIWVDSSPSTTLVYIPAWCFICSVVQRALRHLGLYLVRALQEGISIVIGPCGLHTVVKTCLFISLTGPIQYKTVSMRLSRYILSFEHRPRYTTAVRVWVESGWSQGGSLLAQRRLSNLADLATDLFTEARHTQAPTQPSMSK